VGEDDIGGVRPEDLAAFRAVGSHLARRGLVRGSEGNLSTFDGRRLVITRTGSQLGSLEPGDLLVGTASNPPAEASSDLGIHLDRYRESEEVAGIVHAHPPGSVPAGWVEGEAHGIYALGTSLEHAMAHLDASVLGTSSPPMLRSIEQAIGPFAAVDLRFDEERWTTGGWVRHGPWMSILDQTRLPAGRSLVECRSVEDVAEAIRRLAVRGAPVLGVTAALGVAQAVFGSLDRDEDVREAAAKAGELLVSTRPTAVNIRWAVDRVLDSVGDDSAEARFAERVLAEARAIQREDAAACSAMGWFGSELIPEGANVLTHCNTGMLCTAGIGTAFGVLWCSHLEGKGIHVWVDETRPLLQGARLTAWELQRLGVPFTVIAGGAAGSLMARGQVDAVILGADRIAANGDVANKVGTYSLAVLAARHGVPFYVAAPTSTIDPSTPSGDHIEIEERDPEEVTHAFGTRIAPEGAPALNPAFDVTPAELVTAIVTERGVVRPPFADGLAAVLEGAA
jgi:methylthioribose-1-phosphate isomerase